MKKAEKPFPEALQDLLDEYEMSLRELSRRSRRKAGWGNPGTISTILRGDQQPSIRGMEAIAKTLQIPPEYFAEYRLAMAREMLDQRSVGLDTALRNLNGN